MLRRIMQHRGVQSVFSLWVGTVAGALLTFATHAVIARVLGVQEFGTFASAFATIGLVAPLAGFGVAGYWLNVYGREGWQAQRWLRGSFRFLILSSTAVLATAQLWAWCGPHDERAAAILSVLSLHVLGQLSVELIGAKFMLEGRNHNLVVWQFVPSALRLAGVGLGLVLMGSSSLAGIHAAIVYAVVALTQLAFGAWELAQLRRGRIRLQGHAHQSEPSSTCPSPGMLEVARHSWPFGLAGLFYLVYFQSDIILVEYLVGESAAGAYGAAFAVMSGVYLLPRSIFQKYLLPRLHRWAHHDSARLVRVYRRGNLFMVVVGLAAMVALWVAGPTFMRLVFGGGYGDAAHLLSILAVCAPFRFLATSLGSILSTRDNMRLKVRLMGGTAVVNVVLNLLLIPELGARGAAYSTVISNVCLCALYWHYSRALVVGIDGS